MNIEEVRKAAAALARVNNWERPQDVYGEDYLHDYSEDTATLCEWAIAELSRRDAERAERSKPIDAEWLLSIGFRDCGSWLAMDVGTSKLWWAQLRRAFGMNGRHVDDITTRGQLLDLLAALKGGES